MNGYEERSIIPGPGERWEEQKVKLKAQFPILTDADLHFEVGERDAMFNSLRVKIGKSRDELVALLKAL